MSSRIFTVPDTVDWKQAYTAAVLEKDYVSMIRRIELAREKITLRLEELACLESPVCDELEAIHDALYLLQGLQSSLLYRNDLGITEA
jgi:hypothetical protein